MDSNSIPVLSGSDPALVNTLNTRAGSPLIEPVTRHSAGPTVPGPPSTSAANPPGKTVVETAIQANNGNQANGVAAAPTLRSSQAPTLYNSSDESDIIAAYARFAVDSAYNSIRREDKYKLLRSLDEDPDEETEATHVRDPIWRWPAYDNVYDGSGNSKFAKRGKAPMAVTMGFPFQVIYRNTRDIVLWPDAVLIKLKSPHLLTILSKYLPDMSDLRYLQKVNVDGRRMYIILEKLKKHQLSSNANETPSTITGSVVLPTEIDQNGASQGVSNGSANLATDSSEIHSQDPVSPSEETNQGAGKTVQEAGLHLHHLVRFLEEEYAVVALRERHLKEDKSVSFDMLWAFLTPGTTVVYQCTYTQEQLCAKVLDTSYEMTRSGKMFTVTLAFWDYNGAAYRQCAATRRIGQFSGEKPFDTLGIFPIDKDRATSAETLTAEFLAKGRRFWNLAMRSSSCFQHYNGASFRLRHDEVIKEKSDGRVMVDLRSFAMVNPDYPMQSAQPPVAPPSDADESDDDLNDEAAEALVGKSAQEVEEETLIFAPAIVYGFSFTLKLWGAFAVTGFSEINFDTTAFDALVMEPELKQLLYSLVCQFVAKKTFTSGPSSSVVEFPRVDPIANKGEGCIFLCYGPPGTGKTLTAESIAENLRRPLWSLSVAELGTTPGDLEKTLLKILEIAAMWKAVLLLDEADVYLEKRVTSTDMTRNAMTGVFLRLLEYYRGVLFLTTNRITTFDDAFRSRISLVVCYPNLDAERREQIWRTALARIQAGKGEEVKVGTAFLADMAEHNINGREIRNVIHIAQTLARSKNEELQEWHLRVVMCVLTQTSERLDVALRDV